MTYDILETGSSGNCVIINGEIAIDMGIPMKKLRESGYIKSLKLVLLTHAHGDHFNRATVRALHKERPALRWGCCEWMVVVEGVDGKPEPGPLIKAGVDKRAIDVYRFEHTYRYGDFQLSVEPTIHDVPNCCYHINAYGDLVFYATDCSTLNGIEAKGYDLYMLEANHTRAEIEARITEKQARGEFAYESRAAQNHLSQEQAMDWLARNAGPQSRYVFLHQHKEDQHEKQH